MIALLTGLAHHFNTIGAADGPATGQDGTGHGGDTGGDGDTGGTGGTTPGTEADILWTCHA